MLFPEKYKSTREASIGKPYIWFRRLASLTIITSFLIFGFASQTLGFWLMLGGFLVEGMLVGRERYICTIRDIDKITELRSKLIDAGEHEFVLESIAADQIWRGEAVSEEVTSRLNKIRNEREEIKTKLEGFLTKLVSDFGTTKTNDEDGN